MNISIRELNDGSGYADVSIEIDGNTLDIGFLTPSERFSLAKTLLMAAMDLLEKVKITP